MTRLSLLWTLAALCGSTAPLLASAAPHTPRLGVPKLTHPPTTIPSTPEEQLVTTAKEDTESQEELDAAPKPLPAHPKAPVKHSQRPKPMQVQPSQPQLLGDSESDPDSPKARSKRTAGPIVLSSAPDEEELEQLADLVTRLETLRALEGEVLQAADYEEAPSEYDYAQPDYEELEYSTPDLEAAIAEAAVEEAVAEAAEEAVEEELAEELLEEAVEEALVEEALEEEAEALEEEELEDAVETLDEIQLAQRIAALARDIDERYAEDDGELDAIPVII